MQNNEGHTPLFVAVETRNMCMMKFIMNNQVQVPDLSIRNKSGETVREYLERNIFVSNDVQPNDHEGLELPEVKSKYVNMDTFWSKYKKYECRILFNAMLGVTGP
jgi:hypothetical protein